jgi:hypothetical protein
MKSIKYNPLLKELLAEDSLEGVRRRSLEQGMTIAHHRRQRANWAKGALVSAAVVTMVCLLGPGWRSRSARRQVPGEPVPNTAMVASVASTAKGPAAVRFISDEELLAFFPGRSLALIGPPGHKTLFFLDQVSLSKQD